MLSPPGIGDVVCKLFGCSSVWLYHDNLSLSLSRSLSRSRSLSLTTHHSPLNLQPQPQPQPKPQPQLHPDPNQVRLYHDNVLSRAPGSAPTRWHCDDGPAGYMAVDGPQVVEDRWIVRWMGG